MNAFDLSNMLTAAKELVAAISFDDSGVNGRGGNGGLLSRETIRRADELRLAIGSFERAQREETPWAEINHVPV
jgi:hypothetical protein